MALLQNEKTLSINDIRTGQVLKIKYDGDEDLILVVDPEATTVVSTSQGRVGKLHAIKLRNMSEYDMFQLIKLVRDLKGINPRLIYDTFKDSPYAMGKRNYRTYTRKNISNIRRVTIGQVTKGTNKLIVDDSILYGVNHDNYVEVSMDHYSTIIREIKERGYKIYYEGVRESKPEPIVLEFLDVLETFDDTFDTSKLKFESWDIDMEAGVDELTTILPLFGPGFSDFKKNIQKGIGKQSTDGKTLMDVLVMSTGGWIRNVSPEVIERTISLAPTSVRDTLSTYLSSEYDEKTLKKFHALGQTYAFANFEGPDIEKGTEIEKVQIIANEMRDKRLKHFMKTKPGVYFAGSGHISLVKKLP